MTPSKEMQDAAKIIKKGSRSRRIKNESLFETFRPSLKILIRI